MLTNYQEPDLVVAQYSVFKFGHRSRKISLETFFLRFLNNFLLNFSGFRLFVSFLSARFF